MKYCLEAHGVWQNRESIHVTPRNRKRETGIRFVKQLGASGPECVILTKPLFVVNFGRNYIYLFEPLFFYLISIVLRRGVLLNIN